MKMQWSLVFALVFAVIVAFFAVINVEPVIVDFLFMQQTVPLILVIVLSALAGAIIVGFYGIFRQYRLQGEIKRKNRMIKELEEKITALEAAQVRTSAESAGPTGSDGGQAGESSAQTAEQQDKESS